MRGSIRLFLGLIVLISSMQSQAAEFAILNNQQVKLNQIDFPDESNAVLDSSVGMLQANLISLRSAAGISSGYINMVVDGNWVVRNLPVLLESEYPYALLSTQFDLGVNEGVDIDSISATLLYSDDVKQSAPTTTSATFSVGSQVISVGGVGLNGVRGARGSTTPPNLNDVLFGDPTDTRAIFQLDHPNIEAADDQCYPMAIANSLQFLANTTTLDLPHSHVAGVKGDSSLVGQLDTHMNRTVTSRTNGEGVEDVSGLQGKMNYLLANGLEGQIQTRHWGRYSGNTQVLVTQNGKTATSTGLGLAIDFEKVVTALEEGENCEAAYTHDSGGHAVDIAAAGYTNGQPWIIESSDINQDSDSAGAGPEGFIFSHLIDSDKDGDFNMNGTTQELDLVICQKYIPAKVPTGTFIPLPGIDYFIPGVELEVTETDDPAGHSCCVNPLPSMVSLEVVDGRLVINAASGNASPSYFPFALDINSAGGVSGSNVTDVAGYSGINNSVSGRFEPSGKSLTAEISLGTNGGLPEGQAISWNFEIMAPEEGWPWATQDAPAERAVSIRANGFRSTLTISQTDSFSLGIGIDPGIAAGDGELYIVVQTGDLTASYSSAGGGTWLPGISATASGPLGEVANQPMFTLPDGGLPPGEYTFYFAVDSTINNMLDSDSLVFDSIVVTVE